jgi:uncharacterized membrane protein (DUF441 family)
METGILIILIVLILGILSHNNSLSYSAAIVLILRILNLKNLLDLMDKNAIKWGIIVLTVGVLTPFITGKVGFKEIKDVSKSPTAIIAVLAGLLTAIIAGRGLNLIAGEPSIVIGIVIGSVIGVAFFNGVAIGPMTAAGLLAVILGIIKR